MVYVPRADAGSDDEELITRWPTCEDLSLVRLRIRGRFPRRAENVVPHPWMRKREVEIRTRPAHESDSFAQS